MKTLRAHLLLMLVVVAVAVYESRAADTNSDAATAAAATGEPTGTQYYHPRSHPTHGYRGLDRDSYQPPYHKDGRPTHGYHDQDHGLYQPPYYKDSHDEPYGRYGGDGYYPKHDDATKVDANCTANWWKKADAKDTCICATIEKCLPPSPPPPECCVDPGLKICLNATEPTSARKLVEGRYRLANNNWDMALITGTQNPFPTVGTPGFNSTELGNPATPLSGEAIPFEFTYNVRTVPAVPMMTQVQAGYTWQLSNLPNSAPASIVTQDFSPTDTGIGGAVFSDPHNAILIGLSARFNASGSGSSSAVLTGAKFEITESLDPFILCGSTDIPTTSVATNNGVADPIDGSQKSLWIVADRDLSRTSWRITGNITLTSTRTSGGGEELVKFFINVKETGPVTAKDIVERCPETCGEPMVKRVPAVMDAAV